MGFRPFYWAVRYLPKRSRWQAQGLGKVVCAAWRGDTPAVGR
jgi:hypothetical protein